MKITNAHYAYMKNAIGMTVTSEMLAKHRTAIVKEGKVKDIEMRLRWDVAYASALTNWICKEVYPYANDDHVDTALRAIMRELYGVSA